MMADETDDSGEDFTILRSKRPDAAYSFERRRTAEEQAVKTRYFPKWLQEAGVIAFLDFLLADGGTTPGARQRAKDLRDRLMQEGCSAHPRP